MTTENPSGAGGGPSGGGQAPAPGAAASGTPGSPPAEAGGTVDPAKLQERNTYLESELKKTIEQRDQAKSKWSEQPEVMKLRERAAVADKLEAEAKSRAEKESVERGEFQKLYGDAKTTIEQLTKERDDAKAEADAKVKDLLQKQKFAAAKSALTSGYQSVGGFDVDTFGIFADKAIADGKVTVADDGQVQGAEAFIKSVQEGKPHLFGKPGSTTLPGGVGSSSGLDITKITAERGRPTLAHGPTMTREEIAAARRQLK